MRLSPHTHAEIQRLSAILKRREKLLEADDAECAGRADVLRNQFADAAIELWPVLETYADRWAGDEPIRRAA